MLPPDLTGMFAHADTAGSNDVTHMGPLADRLDAELEGWAAPERLIGELRHAHNLALTNPDQLPTFRRTPSEGWRAVTKGLEALAEHPADTDDFRQRCERLCRGNVPLDLQHLEPTLRLQYDLQVGLLDSLGLLVEDDDGRHGITAIDGKSHPLPALGHILARVQTPEMQKKIRQGFDTLLLVPFGLPLDRFTDAWRAGLTRNEATLRGVGAFDAREPLWVWDRYRDESPVYEPHSFTDDHGGRTKAELVRGGRAWDVLLVEGAIPNLPRGGRGQTIGGRAQVACNRTPTEYLADLRSRGETGLTPEAYAIQFLDALERQGRVLDVETLTYLTGSYLPATRGVPDACWRPGYGRAYLAGDVPGYRDPRCGVRPAVRVR